MEQTGFDRSVPCRALLSPMPAAAWKVLVIAVALIGIAGDIAGGGEPYMIQVRASNC